jgi:hypothetical protein
LRPFRYRGDIRPAVPRRELSGRLGRATGDIVLAEFAAKLMVAEPQ